MRTAELRRQQNNPRVTAQSRQVLHAEGTECKGGGSHLGIFVIGERRSPGENMSVCLCMWCCNETLKFVMW